MDMNLSINPYESFRQFQGMIMGQYDKMAESDDFVLMDATRKVDRLQAHMREIVNSRIDLERFRPRP